MLEANNNLFCICNTATGICSETLSRSQWDLFQLMLENQNKVVCRDAIVDQIYPTADGVSSQAVDAMVGRLRTKIRQVSVKSHIETVYGWGWILDTAIDSKS